MLDHFEYVCPTAIQEVFSFLEQTEPKQVHVLAGGTDLIPELRLSAGETKLLVDISNLNLNYVSKKNNELRIGAATTFRTLERNPVILDAVPILASAAHQIVAVQTRSLATIGGNLCTAAPSADSAAPLIALNASLMLVGKSGNRLIPVADFFQGPRRTVLQRGEILTEIIIPLSIGRKASFKKIGRRKALCLSLVNCAVSFCLDYERRITDARIALGSLAPVPMRAMKAEGLLNGNLPSAELFELAGESVKGEINPTDSYRASAEYKRRLAEVTVRRCLADTLRQFSAEMGERC